MAYFWVFDNKKIQLNLVFLCFELSRTLENFRKLTNYSSKYNLDKIFVICQICVADGGESTILFWDVNHNFLSQDGNILRHDLGPWNTLKSSPSQMQTIILIKSKKLWLHLGEKNVKKETSYWAILRYFGYDITKTAIISIRNDRLTWKKSFSTLFIISWLFDKLLWQTKEK